jgi:hypothetical protein
VNKKCAISLSRPSKGDDMFDDELENDLVAAVDENSDGFISFSEFRRGVRRRVALNDPSPYAPLCQLQAKFRTLGGLDAHFWEGQARSMRMLLDGARLWTCTEVWGTEGVA